MPELLTSILLKAKQFLSFIQPVSICFCFFPSVATNSEFVCLTTN